MMSTVNQTQNNDDLWLQQGKWSGSFKIEFIHIKDISNVHFTNIDNPYNENKPVYQGRDCTEIYQKSGQKCLSIFNAYKPLTSLYDNFKYYDHQEKIRQD